MRCGTARAASGSGLEARTGTGTGEERCGQTRAAAAASDSRAPGRTVGTWWSSSRVRTRAAATRPTRSPVPPARAPAPRARAAAGRRATRQELHPELRHRVRLSFRYYTYRAAQIAAGLNLGQTQLGGLSLTATLSPPLKPNTDTSPTRRL